MPEWDREGPFLRITVKEAERVPPFYGVSYPDFIRRVRVCHPIPINWIVRAWRNLVFYLKSPPFSDKMNEVRMHAYWDGAEEQRRGVILCDKCEEDRQSKRGRV